MGTLHYLAAPATQSKGGFPTTLLFLAAMIGVFYLLILRPQRKRQREAAQRQSQIMPGQRVRTTAGMYGTVVSGDDRDIVIEIAPGVEVTMLRRAIMDIVPDDSESAEPEDEPAESAEPAFEAAPVADGPAASDHEAVTGSEPSDEQDGKDPKSGQGSK